MAPTHFTEHGTVEGISQLAVRVQDFEASKMASIFPDEGAENEVEWGGETLRRRAGQQPHVSCDAA